MSSTPLGQSMLDAFECNGDVIDECLRDLSADVTSLTLQQLSSQNDELVAQLVLSISSLTNTKDENEQEILERSVRAVFCYGTLRADLTPDGDKWGVMSGLKNRGKECVWHYGRITGYALYQDPQMFYPFATPSPSGSLYGTLLTWPSDDGAFVEALHRCNAIEAWVPDGSGLYLRDVVSVVSDTAGTVDAYVYYQNASAEHIASCVHFPDGDWFNK